MKSTLDYDFKTLRIERHVERSDAVVADAGMRDVDAVNVVVWRLGQDARSVKTERLGELSSERKHHHHV